MDFVELVQDGCIILLAICVLLQEQTIKKINK